MGSESERGNATADPMKSRMYREQEYLKGFIPGALRQFDGIYQSEFIFGIESNHTFWKSSKVNDFFEMASVSGTIAFPCFIPT